MELTLSQPELSRVLTLVSRAVSTRHVLPVLAHVLLVAQPGRVQLAATDLELSLTSGLNAEVRMTGAVTVPARPFLELVNTLPKKELHLTLNLHTLTLTIESQGSHTQIKGLDAKEFPSLPQAESTERLPLPVADLRNLIPQVTLAASHEEARPALTGVFLQAQNSSLTFATADGFRLAEYTLALSAPTEPFVCLLPTRALHELGRALTATTGWVEMTRPTSQQVVFRTPEFELTSQLLDASFPDYAPVIPQTASTCAVVPTAAWLQACRQAEIFARESNHTTRFELTPGNAHHPGSLKLFAQADETGSHETCLEAAIEGAPMQIAFNVRFLRDILEVMPTPHTLLETNQPNTPGVLRPHGENHLLYVLMPMHTG